MIHFIRSLTGRPPQLFLLGSRWILILLLIGCGGAGIGGGINLDAPAADLEGGTTREAFICGNSPGAPSGAFVRITNISDPTVPPVEADLDANSSYSLEQCMTVGQSVNVQIFDASGNAISEISSINRLPDSQFNCSPATNDLTNCPL